MYLVTIETTLPDVSKTDNYVCNDNFSLSQIIKKVREINPDLKQVFSSLDDLADKYELVLSNRHVPGLIAITSQVKITAEPVNWIVDIDDIQKIT